MSNPKLPSSSTTPAANKFEQSVFDNIYAHVLGHLAASEWAKEKYGNHELVASHAARFAHAAMEQRTKPFRPVKYADGVPTKTPPPAPVPDEPIAELPANNTDLLTEVAIEAARAKTNAQAAPTPPPVPPTPPVNPLTAMKELADLANR
jgi:hypothetical protein